VFDAGKWTPNTTALVEFHHYVESTLAWREIPISTHVEDFTTNTADHGGFKFITYVLTILWHI